MTTKLTTQTYKSLERQIKVLREDDLMLSKSHAYKFWKSQFNNLASSCWSVNDKIKTQMISCLKQQLKILTQTIKEQNKKIKTFEK